MKVSEAIEVLKTLDPNKILVTAFFENGNWVFDRSVINDKIFRSDVIEYGLNPDKVIVIS